MIDKNIRILRKRQNWSQEQLAEKLDVSRQTAAKWENGEALPDIYQSKVLSDLFEVTVDQLSRDMSEGEVNQLAPKGKQFFGVVKLGEHGQIVIPKEARDMYQLEAGDHLVVLGEDATQGLALLKREGFTELADMIQNAEVTEHESE